MVWYVWFSFFLFRPDFGYFCQYYYQYTSILEGSLADLTDPAPPSVLSREGEEGEGSAGAGCLPFLDLLGVCVSCVVILLCAHQGHLDIPIEDCSYLNGL